MISVDLTTHTKQTAYSHFIIAGRQVDITVFIIGKHVLVLLEFEPRTSPKTSHLYNLSSLYLLSQVLRVFQS